MQGLGNDYVYVNCFEEKVEAPKLAAKALSDRHFGIGADGLILICPSEKADCRMEMYNADGSRGAMCGNGIRCVAKYVYEAGLVKQTRMIVETDSGLRRLTCILDGGGSVRLVEVDMGIPCLSEEKVLTWEEEQMLCTPVDMGNPHGVLFYENVDGLELSSLGPAVERHPCFPGRVNAEFVQVVNQKLLKLRVWERGTGETLACGTGACAAFAAARKKGLVEKRAAVRLPGGILEIFWPDEEKPLTMTGPATEVFRGEISWENFRKFTGRDLTFQALYV